MSQIAPFGETSVADLCVSRSECLFRTDSVENNVLLAQVPRPKKRLVAGDTTMAVDALLTRDAHRAEPVGQQQ